MLPLGGLSRARGALLGNYVDDGSRRSLVAVARRNVRSTGGKRPPGTRSSGGGRAEAGRIQFPQPAARPRSSAAGEGHHTAPITSKAGADSMRHAEVAVIPSRFAGAPEHNRAAGHEQYSHGRRAPNRRCNLREISGYALPQGTEWARRKGGAFGVSPQIMDLLMNRGPFGPCAGTAPEVPSGSGAMPAGRSPAHPCRSDRHVTGVRAPPQARLADDRLSKGGGRPPGPEICSAGGSCLRGV
jgi:hypothetical protein